MTDPLLPRAAQAFTTPTGQPTNPFHAWCSAVDRALRSGTLSVEGLVAQIASMTAQIEAIEPGLPLSTAVTGSANTIDVSGSLAAGAVILDIADTYAGQSSITTLGTVTTGEWNATRITNANLAQMSSKRFKGRTTGGVGDPEDLSVGTVQGMLGVAAPLAAMTLVGNNTGSTATAQAPLTVAEVQAMLGVGAGLTSSITDGDTTHSPTGDAVFDALAGKVAKTGDTMTGQLTVRATGLQLDMGVAHSTIASGPLMSAASDGNLVNENISCSTTVAFAPRHNFYRGRGTCATPSDVVSGDTLGALQMIARIGGAWQNAATVTGNVDGSPGATYAPGQLIFSTADATSGIAVRWSVRGVGTFEPAADNTYNIGSASLRVSAIYSRAVYIGAGSAFITSGTGTPEGVVVAPVGSMFTRTDGGATTTLYVKTSGAGNTGWTAK